MTPRPNNIGCHAPPGSSTKLAEREMEEVLFRMFSTWIMWKELGTDFFSVSVCTCARTHQASFTSGLKQIPSTNRPPRFAKGPQNIEGESPFLPVHNINNSNHPITTAITLTMIITVLLSFPNSYFPICALGKRRLIATDLRTKVVGDHDPGVSHELRDVRAFAPRRSGHVQHTLSLTNKQHHNTYTQRAHDQGHSGEREKSKRSRARRLNQFVFAYVRTSIESTAAG